MPLRKKDTRLAPPPLSGPATKKRTFFAASLRVNDLQVVPDQVVDKEDEVVMEIKEIINHPLYYPETAVGCI